MIVYNCPIGRVTCDGCNNFLTEGCLLKQSQPQQLLVTHDDMLALYDRKREELMKLSKEELVEIIIGEKEYVGMIIG